MHLDKGKYLCLNAARENCFSGLLATSKSNINMPKVK